MPQVVKTALVRYSTQQMFALVLDINNYSEFLPWCANSNIINTEPTQVTASLTINYHGLKQQFTTTNKFANNDFLKMKLLDGPFKYLNGSWNFTELTTDTSKLDFVLDFEFNNFILQKIGSRVLVEIANTILDSFIHRAQTIYGK